MISRPAALVGASGRRYLFQQFIREPGVVGSVVWLAKSGETEYFFKTVPSERFTTYTKDIGPRLRDSPYIRFPEDTVRIPEDVIRTPDSSIWFPDDPLWRQRMFVFKLANHRADRLLLPRAQDPPHAVAEIPLTARKQILKASLRGIAELHDQDVVHLNIMPLNITVDYSGSRLKPLIKKVQVDDVENATYLPKGRHLEFAKYYNTELPRDYNHPWGSPELLLKGNLNKPADIFSFAIMCIYAILGRVILRLDPKVNLGQGTCIPHEQVRLQRQICYFRDQDGVNGLMAHVGDSDTRQLLTRLWEARHEYYPIYRPFSGWPDVDEAFRDLILRMTNLDPGKRITAREALEHPWFEGCDIDSERETDDMERWTGQMPPVRHYMAPSTQSFPAAHVHHHPLDIDDNRKTIRRCPTVRGYPVYSPTVRHLPIDGPTSLRLPLDGPTVRRLPLDGPTNRRLHLDKPESRRLHLDGPTSRRLTLDNPNSHRLHLDRPTDRRRRRRRRFHLAHNRRNPVWSY